MKRIIAFLLALAAMTGTLALVSCAQRKNTGSSDSDLETDDTYPLPDDLYFEGEEVNFIVMEGKNGSFSARSIAVDAPDGDAVDQQIYERNQFIQSKIGVTINLVSALPLDNSGGLSKTVKPALEAGVRDYDVIGGYQYYDLALAYCGLIYDLNSLSGTNADYLHVDSDYWATDYVNALQYGKGLYWLTGDLSLRYTSGMFAMFVNANLYDKYCKDEYGSIFDVVREHRWTYDTLAEMGRRAYEDNGSTPEKIDKQDQLGFISSGSFGKLAMLVASGLRTTETNADGSMTFLINSKNAEAVKRMSATYHVYHENDYALFIADDDDVEGMTIFAGGTALFAPTKLFTAEVYLREMVDDFRIIPLPMLDEKQEEYRTLLHDGVTIYGINHALEEDHLPAVTATLELMAYLTHKKVTPVYYDSALKYKYTRDDDSAEMIDLIRDTTYTDFGLAWDKDITANWLRTNLGDNCTSMFKKYENKWLDGFKTIITKFDALDATK